MAREPTGEGSDGDHEGLRQRRRLSTATLDNGTITALTVDASGETAGFGRKCGEEDFTAQFIGKTLPVTLGEDVDAVAGATITSTRCGRRSEQPGPLPLRKLRKHPEATEAPRKKPRVRKPPATMKGFASDVTVTATLDNGTITALTVDASGETAGFGQKCGEEDFTAQFIGKTLPHPGRGCGRGGGRHHHLHRCGGRPEQPGRFH